MALANDIGKFLVKKIDRIRSDIEAVDLDQSARDAVPDDLEVDGTQTFSDFQPLTEDNVYGCTYPKVSQEVRVRLYANTISDQVPWCAFTYDNVHK